MYKSKLAALFGVMIIMTQPAFAGEDKDKDKAKDEMKYVYLKPVTLPVLSHAGGIDQFISVTVTLEFDDAATADKERAILPRIVDGYLQDLYGALDNKKILKEGVLDPMALKAELEASNTRILGPIHCNVLLQNLGQRGLGNKPSAL